MADQVQWRRGTTAETAAFIGAQGEITVDTDKDVAVVHDGVTPGGFPAAKETAITNTTIYFDDNVGGGSVADAYVLTPKSNTRTPTNYFDGITLGFVTANPNTGPSTVNFSGLGVKNIKLADGSDPLPSQIDGRIDLVFDLGNDWFELLVAELSADDQLKLDLYKGNNKALWPKIENSAIDAQNDIIFTVGDILDSSGDILLSLTSALTKQLNAGFVPGNGAGGLFSGAKAPNTTYHCFIIKRDSDGVIDAGFDTDINAANIPAGWSAYRRIPGAAMTDGLSDIIQFKQAGSFFALVDLFQHYSDTAPGTSAVTLTARAPTGAPVQIKVGHFLSNPAPCDYLITQLNQTDVAPSFSTFVSLRTASTSENSPGTFELFTNDSAEYRARSSVGVIAGNNAYTIGWYDEGDY